MIENQFLCSGISPNQGSMGGNLLTFTGNGFIKDKTTIMVGTQFCHIVEFSFTQIKCIFLYGNSNNVSVEVKIPNTSRNCEGQQYSSTITNFTTYTVTNTSLGYPSNVTMTIEDDNLNSTIENLRFSLFDQEKNNLRINGNGVLSNQNVNITFSNVPHGKYNLMVYDPSKGYALRGNTSHNLTVIRSNVTTSNPTSSFLGGNVLTISGKGFLSNEFKDGYNVTICGRKCSIVSSSFGSLNCLIPEFNTPLLQTSYKIASPRKITLYTEFHSNNLYEHSKIDDKDQSTYVYGSNDCFIGFDFGKNLFVRISKIKIVTALGRDVNQFTGSKFEGSNDGKNFQTIHTIDVPLLSNWNTILAKSTQTWDYRYIRFRGDYCYIAELEVIGIIFNKTDGSAITSKTCEGKIRYLDEEVQTIQNAVEYKSSATGKVESLNVEYGSTAGGTSVIFNGQNLDTGGKVVIDGQDCVINVGNSTNTKLECRTSARNDYIKHSLEVKTSKGLVALMGNNFWYAEKWSDSATWGGESFPRKADSVYVPVGQTLIIDKTVPRLKALIIQGNVVFEDEQDMTFEAEYIIVKDGYLQIGTPQNRFEHNLTITLYGDRKSTTLPGFGSKGIMVQSGRLDIHGKKRNLTWTFLESTVQSKATSITLTEQVDWQVNEQIIIAPTSTDRFHAEQRTIKSITNRTITLDRPLEFAHYAGQMTFGQKTVDIRAEVGLLSRNVKIQGDPSTDSTGHGVQIMLKGREGAILGRLSYFEVFRGGQAFILGRYPIHFHMIGNVDDSYVEGCSIHNSFNRGTTIHGVHHLIVKNNVYFNIRGHCIFIEDSIESNNIIDHNLVILVHASNSLLFSDLKPAGIWITEPNNYITNNHVSGSKSFSFWFDLPQNPTGPSSTPNLCPLGNRLGSFDNNVGHSSSIGLRIYPIYQPRTYPCKPVRNTGVQDVFADNPPIPAVMKNNTMYSNTIGYFAKIIGAVQQEQLTVISNVTNVSIGEPGSAPDSLSKIDGSLNVGTSELTTLHGQTNSTMLLTGRKDGFLFKDVEVYNFPSGCLISACEGCGTENHRDKGVRRTTFTNLKFQNVQSKKICYRDAAEDKDVFYDTDGSLLKHMGEANSTGGWITPYFPHLNVNGCKKISDTTKCSADCIICDKNKKIQRLEIIALSDKNLLKGQELKVFNLKDAFSKTEKDNLKYGIVPYRNAELSLNWRGWTISVVENESYNVHWGTGVDFIKVELTNNLYWGEEQQNTYLRFNHTQPRELYDVWFDGFDTDKTKKIQKKLGPVKSAFTNDNKYGDALHDSDKAFIIIKLDGKRYGKVLPEAIYCRDTCQNSNNDQNLEDRERFWSKAADWKDNKVPVKGDSVEIPCKLENDFRYGHPGLQ